MKQKLTLENIKIAYGKNTILEDCGFSLASGRILSLLGASGCGKSTLLKAIAGLLPIQAGRILLDDTLISAPGHLLAPEKNRVGMIFQDYALFPHLTVLENVAFGLHKLPAKERYEKAREGLSLVRLENYTERYPHELSGGQQQRVSIVRALVCKPTLLLFDEPFSNLDVSVRTVLMQDIKQLLKTHKITAIFVTHDRTESFTMADEIAIIRDGGITQIGEPQQLYDAPNDREIAEFLGSGVILPAKKTTIGWQTDLGTITAAQRDKVIIWEDDSQIETTIYLRPRQIRITPSETGEAVITERFFRGDFYVYQLTLAAKTLELVSQNRLAVDTRVELSLIL